MLLSFVLLLDDKRDTGMAAELGGMLLGLLLAAVVVYWPIDYLIHKKTVKEFTGKPATVDPRFKLKRNLVLATVAGAFLVIWLSNL